MGVYLCIGSDSGEHRSLISRRARTITRWNKAVDVSVQDNLDSMPNLMRLGPERSALMIDESRLARLYRNRSSGERLTVDAVPVMIWGAESRHRTPQLSIL